MNMMSQVLELSRRADIPDNIVARKILGVSRATTHLWVRNGVPKARVEQVTQLIQTLQHYLDSGILPIERDEMLWQGLVHVTECVPNIPK